MAWARSNLGLAQSILFGLSLVFAFLLYVLKPYRKWRVQRGDAEAKRLQVFALMMSDRGTVTGGDPLLLPLQLECFLRDLFFDQRAFFARRGWQQRLTVFTWRVVGFIALLLVLASVTPQLLRLEAVGLLLPEAVQRFIAGLPLGERHYALAGLIGGALQGLLAALTVMSPAERNAAKYKDMRKLLDKYTKRERVEAVRSAAALDDHAAEGREWLVLQEVLSEMVPRRLAQLHKTTP